MKIAKLFLIFAFVGAGFFYFGGAIGADSASVIINEVAWMGAAVNENNEWIELKNNTAGTLDLGGWTLKAVDGTPAINLAGSISASSYFLLERTDDESVPGITADQIYTGALGNSGEALELRDSAGNLIDKVEAQGGWPAGDNTSKKTMERKEDGAWQTSQEAGGTPRKENSINPTPPALPQDNNNPDAEAPATNGNGNSNYNIGDVVINEFVSDPADGDEEWVELYNTTSKVIDLAGWTVEEGSGAKTKLEGEISISGESRFFVSQKISGNLNNKGDIIILRDSTGNLIDQISYGDWNDGNRENNAPVASDPGATARKFDGQNSYNNINDFAVTATPTKGESNIITADEDESEIENLPLGNYDYSNDIIISEIFPNPKGDDSEYEFIELYNQGERDVDLVGWVLGDESERRYEMASSTAIIKGGAYLVIYRSESKLAFNNTSDSVKLFQPLKEKALQVIKYEKAIESWSFNIQINTANINYKYIWSEVVTPFKANIIKTVNHPPLVYFDCPEEVLVGTKVIFDSSDTFDEDGDKLSYTWDFGDGLKNSLASPEHAFLKKGNYRVKLAVSDGKSEAKKEKVIKVSDILVLAAETDRDEATPRLYGGEIIINEFLPSPEGSDEEGEWIELYNQGQSQINLLSWSLDDSHGGSKPYKFLSDFWLGQGMFYMVERSESRLALNNSGDSVRLFNDLNELVDNVQYGASVEGASYVRNSNGQWVWTNVLTPGEENVIAIVDSTKTIKQESKKTNKNGIFINIPLEKIKDFEAGDLIKTEGVVAVRPGVFGSQYFYIVGSGGLQVYNYKKDFSDLAVGDYIEVKGELSVVNGEKRLKTKSKEDMKVLEHQEVPTPEEIPLSQLSEEDIGKLVRIAGEITEKNGSIIYLDDGAGEAVVQIKKNTGINSSDFNEGEAITIAGIVAGSASGPKILPRSPEDIVSENNPGEVQVLGATSESDEWGIKARNKKILYYVLISLGGLAIIAGAIWWKEFKKKDVL